MVWIKSRCLFEYRKYDSIPLIRKIRNHKVLFLRLSNEKETRWNIFYFLDWSSNRFSMTLRWLCAFAWNKIFKRFWTCRSKWIMLFYVFTSIKYILLYIKGKQSAEQIGDLTRKNYVWSKRQDVGEEKIDSFQFFAIKSLQSM